MDDLLKKATDGNAQAMEIVAQNYTDGSNGFAHDANLALQWFGKAHRAGSVHGSFHYGTKLLHRDAGSSTGVIALVKAASSGHRTAAHWLGVHLASASFGITRDEEEATGWLRTSLKSTRSRRFALTAQNKDEAKHKLQQLLADRQADGS